MKILICLVTTALLLEIYNVEILDRGVFVSFCRHVDRFGMCVGCRSIRDVCRLSVVGVFFVCVLLACECLLLVFG